jgi:membrane protein involved in colicin uptake
VREVSTVVVATEKAIEMRTAEETTAVKAVMEVAAAKVVADKATTDKAVAEKVATDKAVVNKVTADKALAMKVVVAKAAIDVAMTNTASQGAAAVRSTVRSMGSGSGSSPVPVVGFKRAAAPGGSTPPSKRFGGFLSFYSHCI